MLRPTGIYYSDGRLQWWMRDDGNFFDQILKLLSKFTRVLTEEFLSKIEIISG